jgi:hypothetical protein
MTIHNNRLGKVTDNPHAPQSIVVPLDERSIARLMIILCDTRDDELSCEEVFSRLDEYVDCLMGRYDVGQARSLFEFHLDRCIDCRDQLEALIQALEDAIADDVS